MGNRSKRTALEIERAEKRSAVLSARLEGLTWQQVADRFGYGSDQAPAQLAKRAIRDIYAGKAEEYLAIHLERLEALLADAVSKGKQRKDPHWNEQARKILLDMRQMLGLNKPTHQVVETTVRVNPEDLEAKLAAIGKRAAVQDPATATSTVIVNDELLPGLEPEPDDS